jgi:prepilin-type N-terminal cleavage/methylation domain-containing protein
MKSTAFTLIELLVVIAIVGVLAGLLLPAIGSVKSSVKQMTCAANQGQFMAATIMYATDNRGVTPSVDSAGMTNPPPGRSPHLTLMRSGYIPESFIVGSPDVWGGVWVRARLRWPNPMQCPAIQPERFHWSRTAYGYRWTTSAAAWSSIGLSGSERQPSNNGSAYFLRTISNVMPFMGEAHNPAYFAAGEPGVDPGTHAGMNWHNDAGASTAGWFDGRLRLTHRGRAVVAWVDGRSAARSLVQLGKEDGVLGVVAPPIP